ncbi:hypothetical protein [Shewanella algae]|uniref:hypothetical protein n=1 Tax=Shewanella algae TaxID=38313 RepID=UPI00265B5FC5|nr:hypothetical protein [Shewanella algae]WKC40636.1 hypothetical protein QYM03_14855 [Shewanella algae]
MIDALGRIGLTVNDSRSIVVLSENGMQYKANNVKRKNVICYDVDGVMIASENKKCDKALGVPDDRALFLVELKGCDLKKASEQIFSTIQALDEKIGEFKVFGRIVCSRVPKPDIRSTQVVRLERELAKRNGNLKKNSRVLEEDI